MTNIILTRYGEPSKYDHGPFGSICKVIKAVSSKYDVYVQVNNDEENPTWHLIGSFSDQTDDDLIDQVNQMLERT